MDEFFNPIGEFHTGTSHCRHCARNRKAQFPSSFQRCCVAMSGACPVKAAGSAVSGPAKSAGRVQSGGQAWDLSGVALAFPASASDHRRQALAVLRDGGCLLEGFAEPEK